MEALESGPPPRRVVRALERGICPNERAFDRFLPYELRLASSEHWTPLVVALRVAEWLRELDVRTVVDIGCGPGKFCVATALATRCMFAGVEQRPHLVAAARRLARLFEVEDRVRFVEGALGQIPLPRADAYYLFNPFGENLLGADEHLGDDVEVSHARYRRDVALTERLLGEVPVGTYVIKYNGFGGKMPPEFEPIRVDREMPNVLRAWHKVRVGAA